MERGGFEPHFAPDLLKAPTPLFGPFHISGPVCPGCHASLTSALPPRSNPAGVDAGLSRLSACFHYYGCPSFRAVRSMQGRRVSELARLCWLPATPRFQGCFGRLPISHHQAGKKRKRGNLELCGSRERSVAGAPHLNEAARGHKPLPAAAEIHYCRRWARRCSMHKISCKICRENAGCGMPLIP